MVKELNSSYREERYPFLFLCGSQSLSQSLILTFSLDLSSYPFHLYFLLTHSLIKSLTHTHTYCQPQPPLVHLLSASFTSLSVNFSVLSPLVFHLSSRLARSCCHWSVLASLSFPYQTELIWLPY